LASDTSVRGRVDAGYVGGHDGSYGIDAKFSIPVG